MLFTHPLPDEFILGHFGRLRTINCNASFKNIAAYFLEKNQSNIPPRLLRHTTAAIAAASQMSHQEYCRLHTMLPIARPLFVRLGRWTEWRSRATQKIYMFSQQTGRSQFCGTCLKHDRDRLGFGYWHRLHQMPGVHICPKHGRALVAFSTHEFNYSPGTAGLEGSAPSSALIEASHHPIIARYAQVALFLLNQPLLPTASLTQKMEARASAIGAPRFPQGRLFLSKFLRNQIPEAWLQQHFPVMFRSSYGQPFPPLDSVLLEGSVHGHYYALALSALFSSFEEITAILSAAKLRTP